jgi:hypothetical protein
MATGRHSVFKIPSTRWYRPPEVREAQWECGLSPRHVYNPDLPVHQVILCGRGQFRIQHRKARTR